MNSIVITESNRGFNHKYPSSKEHPKTLPPQNFNSFQLFKLYAEFLLSGQNNKTFVKSLKNRHTYTIKLITQ